MKIDPLQPENRTNAEKIVTSAAEKIANGEQLKPAETIALSNVRNFTDKQVNQIYKGMLRFTKKIDKVSYISALILMNLPGVRSRLMDKPASQLHNLLTDAIPEKAFRNLLIQKLQFLPEEKLNDIENSVEELFEKQKKSSIYNSRIVESHYKKLNKLAKNENRIIADFVDAGGPVNDDIWADFVGRCFDLISRSSSTSGLIETSDNDVAMPKRFFDTFIYGDFAESDLMLFLNTNYIFPNMESLDKSFLLISEKLEQAEKNYRAEFASRYKPTTDDYKRWAMTQINPNWKPPEATDFTIDSAKDIRTLTKLLGKKHSDIGTMRSGFKDS